jgi:hypothetical protein
MATAEPPKKCQKVEERPNPGASGESDEEDVSSCILEYADIKNKRHLDRHLSAPIEAVLTQHRLKLHMFELALRAWYMEPEKYIKPEVNIIFHRPVMVIEMYQSIH